jgi:glycosyltransferase involved in cell wall biosynthesis
MTQIPQLSLVMPAYNEAEGIAEAVSEAHESLVGLSYNFEILVVDDGSQDETAQIIAELAATWPRVRPILLPSNQGYGAALRAGFEAARYDLVAFTDADGQFFLEDLDDLIRLSSEYDVVVGRRAHRQDPWRRRFLSWGYNQLVRNILGTRVRDCDCALKVFRREALDCILPESKGFFVNTEMLFLARRFGFDIAELDVRHRARRSGVSKVSWNEVPKTFSKLIKFWYANVWKGQPLERPIRTAPALLAFKPSPVAEEIRRAA